MSGNEWRCCIYLVAIRLLHHKHFTPDLNSCGFPLTPPSPGEPSQGLIITSYPWVFILKRKDSRWDRREQRDMKTKVVCHLDPCEFLSKTGRGWKIKVKIAQVHCPMGPIPRSFVSAVCCNVSGMVHVRLMQYAKWRKSNQRLITINTFYSIYDDYSNMFQLNIVQRDINTSWTNRWIKMIS